MKVWKMIFMFNKVIVRLHASFSGCRKGASIIKSCFAPKTRPFPCLSLCLLSRATKKKTAGSLTFHEIILAGWFIRILVLAYYNPHIAGYYMILQSHSANGP